MTDRLKLGTADVRAESSPHRKAIIEAVCKHPGIQVSELKALTNLPTGGIYHHLGMLEKLGILRSEIVGRHRLVYPTTRARNVSIVLSRTARKILAEIIKNPGRDMKHIIERVDESSRVIYYHLRQLIDAGVVSSSSRTRLKDLTPTEFLQDCLNGAEAAPIMGIAALDTGQGDESAEKA